ncbi:MAG TPA: hypothetical protein DD723_09775 [Candidatus Omnitrophica bacterium]|nr:MAG: hypothetical protein A2Z81_03600 [Omnitrophica WOR_2 bacterium GWA2_45_18]HBR15807.1 hypothetical protein [Candidatus Omnitrophota bacterium]
MNLYVLIRFFIGFLFIFSGLEKLLAPYQNFLYVIQSYDVLPDGFETAAALSSPWIELFLGVFLVVGLWTQWVLTGVRVLLAAFIFIVSQAIIRKLPLTECGCFGEFLSLPLPVVVALDSILWVLTVFLSRKIEIVSFMSLDNYFNEKESKSAR